MRLRIFLLVLVCASLACAQTPEQTLRIPGDVRIPVLLKTFLTAKDTAVGTPIVMETTADVKGPKKELLIPKGAKIYGKVTKVAPWSKDRKESALAIVAERAEWKDQKAVLLAFIVGEVKIRNGSLTSGGGPVEFESIGTSTAPATINQYKDFPIDPAMKLRMAKEEDVVSEIYSTQRPVQMDAGSTFTLKTIGLD